MTTKNEVLNAIRNNDECSLTKISKLLGYSKLSSLVKTFVEDLVSEGVVSEDDETYNYSVYSVNEQAATDDDEEVYFEASDVVIPVNNHGYRIEETSKGFRVTSPNNNTYNLKKTQRMLVINQTGRYLVNNPEQLLGAISHFVETNTMFRTYTITDSYLGRSVPLESINTNPVIIFLQIEKHNKAGRLPN